MKLNIDKEKALERIERFKKLTKFKSQREAHWIIATNVQGDGTDLVLHKQKLYLFSFLEHKRLKQVKKI